MEHLIARLAIKYRRILTIIVVLITGLCLYMVSQLNITTIQTDFLPKGHPYAELQKEFASSFGGAKKIALAIEVAPGKDIFNQEVLEKVRRVTTALEQIHGVDPMTITSLATSKMTHITASADGIRSEPLMWPNIPRNEAEITRLRERVIETPLVYGRYVSRDLESALITADLYENFDDYGLLFDELSTVKAEIESVGLTFRMVGEPIIYGYVVSFLMETVLIILSVIVVISLLLYISLGTFRAVFFPLLSGLLSSIWAFGACAVFGINFDPLLMPVVILLFARGVSHSLQMLLRFDEEVAKEETNPSEAALTTLSELFRPGMLGIATDGMCVAAVSLSSIPFLQKLAFIAVVWVSTIAITGSVLTPVFLSYYRSVTPKKNWVSVQISKALKLFADLAVSPARFVVLGLALALFAVSSYLAVDLQIGDSTEGSPIFHENSQFNRDLAAINTKFGGTDTLMVVVRGDGPDAQKDPEVLESILALQKHMEMQNEITRSFSVADMMVSVNRLLHDDNPHFEELSGDRFVNGELMYQLRANSQAGQLESVIDPMFQSSAVSFFLNSRQSDVIRTALKRFGDFAATHAPDTASLEVGGGVIGMLAAVNEVILEDQIESIGVALLILMVLCTVVYRSAHAGLFFLVPVALSNTVTFGFMVLQDIGMTVNTVPVAAIGIGLGVDYAIYIADRIKEEWDSGKSLSESVTLGLMSSGQGVLITALVLIVSVSLWQFSSLRFQAEMAQLIALWLLVSALSALLITPAMIYIFRPKFIFGSEHTLVIESQLSDQAIT